MLAPIAQLRPPVVPQKPDDTEQTTEPTAPAECEIDTALARPGRIGWARLLKRVFDIGLVHPVWRELARMSYLWRVPHALDGSALASSAGPLPGTALPTALRQSLCDLGLGAPAQSRPAARTINADEHPRHRLGRDQGAV